MYFVVSYCRVGFVSGAYCNMAILRWDTEVMKLAFGGQFGSQGRGSTGWAVLHGDRRGRVQPLPRARPGKRGVHIRCASSMQANRWGRSVSMAAALTCGDGCVLLWKGGGGREGSWRA
jgi:hypothetical protein